MNKLDGFWGGLIGGIIGTLTANLITNTNTNNIEDCCFSFDETFSYVNSRKYNQPVHEWNIVKTKKYIKYFNIFDMAPYHYLACLDSFIDSNAIDCFECSIFDNITSCLQDIWLFYSDKGIITYKNIKDLFIIYTILEGKTLHIIFTEYNDEEFRSIDNKLIKIKVLDKVWCQSLSEGNKLLREIKAFYSSNKKLKVSVDGRTTILKKQERKSGKAGFNNNQRENIINLSVVKDFRFDYLREIIQQKDFFDSNDLRSTFLFYSQLLKRNQLLYEAVDVLERLIKLKNCDQRTFEELSNLYIELKEDEKLYNLLESAIEENDFDFNHSKIRRVANKACNTGLNKSSKFLYESMLSKGININEAVACLFDIYVRLGEKGSLIRELSGFAEDRVTFPLLESQIKGYLSGMDLQDLRIKINKLESGNNLDELLTYYNRYIRALYINYRTFIKPIFEIQRKKVEILMGLKRYDQCWIVLCRFRRNILCHKMDIEDLSQLAEVENYMAVLLLERREYVDALFHKITSLAYSKIIDPQLKLNFEVYLKEDQRNEEIIKEITQVLGKIRNFDFTDNRSLSNLHNELKERFIESGLEIRVKEPGKLFPSEFPVAQGT